MKKTMTSFLTLTLLCGGALAANSTFMVLNSSPAFLDIAGFTADGAHVISVNCGGTMNSDRTCSLTIPSDVTKLDIHMGFGNGAVTKTLTSSKGFEGRLVYCGNYHRQASCHLINN